MVEKKRESRKDIELIGEVPEKKRKISGKDLYWYAFELSSEPPAEWIQKLLNEWNVDVGIGYNPIKFAGLARFLYLQFPPIVGEGSSRTNMESDFERLKQCLEEKIAKTNEWYRKR